MIAAEKALPLILGRLGKVAAFISVSPAAFLVPHEPDGLRVQFQRTQRFLTREQPHGCIQEVKSQGPRTVTFVVAGRRNSLDRLISARRHHYIIQAKFEPVTHETLEANAPKHLLHGCDRKTLLVFIAFHFVADQPQPA